MPKYIQLDDDMVIEMYKSKNYTMREICEFFKVSDLKIRTVIIKNNILLRSAKKYQYNDDIFEVIDSESSAYWLGFLYADGYVRKKKTSYELRLKLATIDKEHVLKFSRFISNDKIPLIYEEYKKSKSYKVSINSKKIVCDLMSHGCVNKKSLILKFPTIDKHLIKHFIRGYFDGDGCICIRMDNTVDFSIASGSIEILESILSNLSRLANVKPKNIRKYKNSNLYTFSYTNIEDIRKIYHLLYDDSSIYLDRKKIKFENTQC